MNRPAQNHPTSTYKKLYPIASDLATNTHFCLMLNIAAQSQAQSRRPSRSMPEGCGGELDGKSCAGDGAGSKLAL